MVNCCAARELEPGLLLDPGIAIAKSITRPAAASQRSWPDAASELTTISPRPRRTLNDFLQDLDRGIGSFDEKIDRVYRERTVPVHS